MLGPKQHDVKKSYLPAAFSGTVQMLPIFLCFSFAACINSDFFVKMEFCMSLALVFASALLSLKQQEDLVFLKFLLCWCNILIYSQFRRSTEFCRTAQSVLHSSCKSDLQKLTVLMAQIIVPCTEVMMQWEQLMLVLSLLFLLLKLLFRQLVHVALLCYILKLKLLNFLTAIQTHYSHLHVLSS